jgi:hypothetical protein
VGSDVKELQATNVNINVKKTRSGGGCKAVRQGWL